MEAIHKLFGDCKPITENEANDIVNDIASSLHNLGIDFCILGSFNKKLPGELYNDIDVAVKYPFENGSELVSKICKEKEDKTKLGKINDKFNTVTISYKVKEDHDAQVDFMFCDSVEYANFVFHSPDFKKQESKYKGMFASILLQSIIKNTYVSKEYFEDGGIKTYTYYSLSQKDGLHKKTKTFIGKRGNRVKSAQLVEDIFVSNCPYYILKLIFGDIDFETVWCFEKLLDYLSENYNKEFIERVKHDFLTDWEFELKTPDELKKEFEELFNQKINSL